MTTTASFPRDLMTLIYEYDPTYRLLMKGKVHPDLKSTVLMHRRMKSEAIFNANPEYFMATYYWALSELFADNYISHMQFTDCNNASINYVKRVVVTAISGSFFDYSHAGDYKPADPYTQMLKKIIVPPDIHYFSTSVDAIDSDTDSDDE